MPSLLLKTDVPDETQAITRIGGRPLAPAHFTWPVCGECGEPMQLLAQVRLRDADPSLSDRLLQLFMCQTPPYLCESRAPGSTANFAVCLELDGLVLCEPPGEGLHALRALEGLRLESFEDAYEDARATVIAPDFVFGHVGGLPDSVSGFVPSCPTCLVPMRFIVQLEQGWDADTAMNFNSATAFGYTCTGCNDAGAIFVDDFF